MERRLSVIMSADLVGFTGLMERDETGTWAQLRALRKELIDPAISHRHGVIFKTTGDGMLAEFKNCTNAVEAAIDVQSAVFERYKALPPDEKLIFRVGIDMGEVIADDGDLIGDAVNVAARLQGVCQPGGVCFSEAVFNGAKPDADIAFEDIGLVELRNRSKPVRSFVWRYGAVIPTGSDWQSPAEWKSPDGKRRGNLEKRTAADKKPVTVLPSIAVLPFENLSSDDELGYLSTGIAEDILTALYRFKSFLVISRTSSFLYAGETKTAQEIGRELGAHYVLEGSVRKLGTRIRITAQLINAIDNDHVWAENYDFDLADVFEAQDQIVTKIAATLGDGIEKHQIQGVKHLSPENLEAYQLMLRGLELHKRGFVSYEQAVEANNLFAKAIEKDPSLTRARAWKVCSGTRLLPTRSEPAVREAYLVEGRMELDKVLETDPDDPETHRMYGSICMFQNDFELAKFHFDRAISVNPNNSHILTRSAYFYCCYGEADRALELLNQAITINPHHPDWYWQVYGLTCWSKEEYKDAIGHFAKCSARGETEVGYTAASHSALGNDADAQQSIHQFRKITPDTTAELFVIRQPFRADHFKERLLEQLKAAGLE